MKKIIFSKYSNERSAEFAVRTDICDEGGRLFLKKTPCSAKACPHVDRICEWYRKLQQEYAGTFLEVNRCKKTQDGVILEYLEGNTLEEILDSLIAKQEYGQMEELLSRYIQCIRETASEGFRKTEPFIGIFGDAELSAEYRSAPVTDIDMVVNNIIVHEKWYLIDYEWTFEFPIPVEFVIFRLLHYYFESTGARSELAGQRKIYQKFGLSEQECRTFYAMEQSFQQYIIRGHEPIRQMYPRISPGAVPLEKTDLQQEMTGTRRLQVFWSGDMEICEENSFRYPLKQGKKMKLQMEFPEPVRRIRMDPGESPCFVSVESLRADGREIPLEACVSNGLRFGENGFLFWKRDPQLIYDSENVMKMCEAELPVIQLPDEGSEVYQSLAELTQELFREKQQQQCMLQEQRDRISALQAEISNRDAEIRQKADLIESMENTRVWKMYRKYRRLKERN